MASAGPAMSVIRRLTAASKAPGSMNRRPDNRNCQAAERESRPNVAGIGRFRRSMAIRVAKNADVLYAYLSVIAYRAIWGYGVDPPADANPHLVACSVRQPDLAGQRSRWCRWAITTAWVRLAPS